MKKLKIVTIGGGSSYTPELIEGLIKRSKELPIGELWLVDIEEGKRKLEIIGALAKRMLDKAGNPFELHTTLNRREALPGADFVTTQLRVGLLDARVKDERIPLSHGCIGQETNGAGGMFKALRTVPVLLDIDRDICELCPDAWMINFTNPVGVVTEALLRYGQNKKIIGLCNIGIGMERSTAKMLDVDVSRIRIDFAGLNHMVFGMNFYLDGVKITDKVLDMLCGGKMGQAVKNIEETPWLPEFIKKIGVLPCSYLRYYFQTKEMLEQELNDFSSGHTRAEVVKGVEKELFKLYQDPNLNVKPAQLEQRGGAYYSEAACRLIDSIYNDRRDIQPVNVRNNYAIAGISSDSAVEVSSVITKNGPVPLTMGELPVAVSGLVGQIKSFERLTAEAAVTGDYGTALVAMTINPLVPSDKLAKVLLDELLEAHKAYLPKFH